ncbi:hypothetical protein Tco_0209691 [Tanacetum coccineum]
MDKGLRWWKDWSKWWDSGCSDGGGGFELLGGKSSNEFKNGSGSIGGLSGVENISARGDKGEASIGDDSFDEMLMMVVLACFLGGLLVDDDAL